MKHSLSKVSLALGLIASAAAFNVAQAASLVGLNTSNQIGVFDSANVAAAAFVNISGLSSGESLIGIDLRPSTNTIYGISSANNVYTVNANSGVATFVTALNTSVINSSLGYGFDFNPVADFSGAASLRLISSAGNNYAVNVNTGVVGNTTSNIGAGNSAVAYSNSSTAGAPANTQLYYVNSNTDTLAVATTGFNAPTITTIGALTLNGNPLDILNANGFELLGNGNAFLAATLNDGIFKTQLFNIDLATGVASQLGTFNGTLNGLAAAPSAVPVPAAAWLFGTALFGFAGFRRKSA